MKYLITGGSGFIGKNLIEYLVNDNEIFSIDKKECPIKHKNLRSEICDITRPNELKNAIKENFDHVIHLAAQTSVQESLKSPKEDLQVNVIGTINLIERIKQFGIPRFTFASTSAVYGHRDHEIAATEYSLTDPVSPYGISKLAAEKYCQINLPTTILRFGNVFGKYQNPPAAIPLFVQKIKCNETVEIYGNCIRDYVYVKDIIDAILNIRYSEVYNVGTGNPIETKKLYLTICEILNKEPNYKELDYRPGDAKWIYLSDGKADWFAKYSLYDGLKDFLNP